MEQPLTYKDFITRLDELPNDMSDAIMASNLLQNLKKVQKDNSLHIDQGANLEDLVFKLILGDIGPENFTETVAKSLYISEDQADKIADVVDHEVLDPIRETFQLMTTEEPEEGSEVKSPELAVEKKENYSDLNTDDILSGIENPHPSIATVHETTVPSASKPASIVQKPVVNIPVPVAPVPNVAPAAQIPVGWPAPATPIPVEAPLMTKPAAPVSKTAVNLNQKLEQPTVSRPVEVSHSIDPYKEAIE